MRHVRFLKPSLDWLLVMLPVAVALHHLRPDRHILIFVTAGLAILPLAGWLGKATEHLAEKTGEGVGGLLNATFGNAAELIIAGIALRSGLLDVVKASLTGSIIGNILLVLGASIVAGGARHKTQRFNATAARSQSTMLTLAAIALLAPFAYHQLAGTGNAENESSLSVEISIVLLATYALSLVFSLHTHKQLFVAEAAEAAVLGEYPHMPWSLRRSLAVLSGSTALLAWMSEILVGSVEHAAHSLGMTSLFVGVVVLSIIGNAAEHSTAVLMARKNRMDLSLAIAIGSSVQIALFVAPLLVLVSHVLAPQPMNLVFTPAEVAAIGVSVIITEQIAGDGESNWLEGVQLLAVYVILAMVFYFLPESIQP